MTVTDAIEVLQKIPGHWPLVVEQPADGSGGGAAPEYLITLDIERGNFPTQGGMAVVILKGKQ